MKVFLTSNLNHYEKIDGVKVAKEIDNKNGLVDQLKSKLDGTRGILFVPADASDKGKIDEYSKILFDALRLSGVVFDNYYVVDDNSSVEDVRDKVLKSDLVFLSGGDTYTQMQYFENIKLRDILIDYEGVIVGQSAGAINLAEDVYNSPECEEDLSRSCYFKGLGKTNINIEPHFVLDTSNFDSDEMLHRSAMLEESRKRNLYAIPDGSHIFDDDRECTIYGEYYLLKDSLVQKQCSDGEKTKIYDINRILGMIKDEKEKKEIIEELYKIYQYKILVAKGNYNLIEVRNFIISVINKYRYKLEVKSFYTNNSGIDALFLDDIKNLCLLENMILQYVFCKYVEKKIKEL